MLFFAFFFFGPCYKYMQLYALSDGSWFDTSNFQLRLWTQPTCMPHIYYGCPSCSLSGIHICIITQTPPFHYLTSFLLHFIILFIISVFYHTPIDTHAHRYFFNFCPTLTLLLCVAMDSYWTEFYDQLKKAHVVKT